jgi:MFS family permease
MEELVTTHINPDRRRRLGWVLVLTSTAYFMVALDATVVATALPRMQADLHVGLTSLQWTLNSYGIAFAAGIITAAALGDRYGRRLIFSIGLALFTVASAACALAPNVSVLIAARTVQGLGGAIVLPLSLTILTTAFPAERRGTIVGIYGGLAGLAVAAGPLVGGAVTQGINWHWIFWINVPIGVAAVVASLRLLPESYGARERLDLAGAGLVTTLSVGAVLLVAFVAWEKRVAQPMVPLRMFGRRAFAIGNATTFFMSGAIFAGAYLVAEEFQFARHYSPVSTGLRLLPFFGVPMIISPLAGALSDKTGRRPVMVTGLALLTAGFTWVAIRGSLATSWVELTLALLVSGIGISMALPTVPTAVLSAVAPHEMGKASGINYMAQRLGGVFAIAISTAVFSANGNLGTPASVTSGFKPALAACAGLALAATVSAIAIPSRAAAVTRTGPMTAATRVSSPT